MKLVLGLHNGSQNSCPYMLKVVLVNISVITIIIILLLSLLFLAHSTKPQACKSTKSIQWLQHLI